MIYADNPVVFSSDLYDTNIWTKLWTYGSSTPEWVAEGLVEFLEYAT